MSDTALIAQAFADAGRPLTLEEVLEATQLADEKKACGLIYYLVNQKRLQKAEPTDDGIESLTAAQHLLAQMEQAIAALGALDGR
jgi:hypothetical protein